jgi:hypothetical protein
MSGRRAGRDRTLEHLINVRHVQKMWTGDPPTVCGRPCAHRRHFVSQHDARIADLQFGVGDRAVGIGIREISFALNAFL